MYYQETEQTIKNLEDLQDEYDFKSKTLQSRGNTMASLLSKNNFIKGAVTLQVFVLLISLVKIRWTTVSVTVSLVRTSYLFEKYCLFRTRKICQTSVNMMHIKSYSFFRQVLKCSIAFFFLNTNGEIKYCSFCQISVNVTHLNSELAIFLSSTEIQYFLFRLRKLTKQQETWHTFSRN